MYKHILIATDGSQLSELPIRQGITLAKSIDAKVPTLSGQELSDITTYLAGVGGGLKSR